MELLPELYQQPGEEVMAPLRIDDEHRVLYRGAAPRESSKLRLVAFGTVEM